MPTPLEKQFTEAMLDIYRIARKETSYNPARFLGMVNERGGLDTARSLLHASGVSEGFTRLALERRLDLTVEALVLSPKWRSLFTSEELALAEARLRQYGYDVQQMFADELDDETVFPTLRRIVSELNDRSGQYEVGRLQEIRKELHPASRSGRYRIFDEAADTVAGGEYTFHFGGRRELQFNVGFETAEATPVFRHGVAFSLEKSQWVQDAAEVLIPKIARFNEFLRLNPAALKEFQMWYWQRRKFSGVLPVQPISPAVAEPETFIMVGKRTDTPPIRFDEILRDFDRLIPLYRFVESTGPAFPNVDSPITGIRFVPGHHPSKIVTKSALRSKSIDVHLHHNELQTKIYQHLVQIYGEAKVGTEQLSGPGNRVDIVVRTGTGFIYYELKPSFSARACVREGFSQLLEYSYWPTAQEAERLILIGEYPPSAEESAYLERLRSTFGLPIWYQWFDERSQMLRE
jgi:hypothetical protein